MAYYCRDCSYKGKSVGGRGECPACGSARISREGSAIPGNRQQRKRGLQLGLLVVSWAAFIGLVLWKLLA